VEREPDPAAACLGVPGDVGDGFLDGSIRGNLYRCWEIRKTVRRLDEDMELVSGVLHGDFVDSADQSEVVEGRRTERVHQTPDVGDGDLRLLLQAYQQLAGRFRIVLEQVLGHVEPQGEAAEHRPQTIVQITAQASPLLLARGHQAFARLPARAPRGR